LHIESDISARPGAAVYAVTDISPQRRVRKSGARSEQEIERRSQGGRIGTVSSSAKGHSVGKMLALAYVQTSHTFNGSSVMVDVEGEPRPAKVVPIPFFDPSGARMRGR
jgi:glycine cleavage system aminomethyltransferase T